MKIKLSLVFAVLGLSLASAKSYQISLTSTTKAGAAELRAGDYNVSVNGTKVKFTEVSSGKSIETDATVQTAAKKFAMTLVDSDSSKGSTKIHEIDLGGTTTKVVFD